VSSLADLPRVDLDSGGMARVSLVLLPGEGAGRVAAVKEMHAHLARDRDCQMRFLDEARITSRVRHPNVVEVLDIVQERDGLRIVMEYVHGASLSQIVKRLAQRGERLPLRHVSAVISGILTGLHAAHEAKTETGQPLDVVHRDVTPRNVLVGVDGVPRLIDFGIARAALRDAPATRTGVARGTPFYMAPEQLETGVLSRRTDIFLCGLILWELVTGQKLSKTFQNEGQFWLMLARGRMPKAIEYVPDISPALAHLLDRALAVQPEDRFASAAAMRQALSVAVPPSPAAELGAFLRDVAAEDLARRDRLIQALRSGAAAEPEPEPDEPDAPAPATATATATVSKTVTGTPPDAFPRDTGPGPETRVRSEPMPSLLTDEQTTTPMIRPPLVASSQAAAPLPFAASSPLAAPAPPGTPALAAPDEPWASGAPRGRRAVLPVAGALVFLTIGAILGLSAMRGEAPPAEADPGLPPSAALSADVPAPVASEPPAPPASSAAPDTPPAAPKNTGSAQLSGTPHPAASQSAGKPAGKLGCTYQDEKKITRITQCSHPDCVRRGRACKPIGQR
jgi:serine/threonine protein kinase